MPALHLCFAPPRNQQALDVEHALAVLRQHALELQCAGALCPAQLSGKVSPMSYPADPMLR